MGTRLAHLVRRLGRAPAFTLVVLATIAIATGANTAIFAVVNGVLFKPLPYPEPDRLVAVWHTAPGIKIPKLNASPATYFIYREESRTFQDNAIWTRGSASVTGLAEPEQVPALYATGGLLPILGVAPAHGRHFSPADSQPRAPRTVILSHGYWLRRFGGETSAVGKTLMADGEAYTIIGVMPAHFRFYSGNPSLIFPLQFDRARAFIGNFSYQGVARLKPGATIAQANTDVARMLPMLSQKFPPAPGMNAKMIEEARIGPDVHSLHQEVVGDSGKVLWVLMGSLGLLLLVACANVANLMLVRAEGRHQELAVRAALGAGWQRIAGNLLSESVALGLAGGALGLGLAYAAIRALLAAAPAGLPRLQEIAIDPAVLAFAAAISLVAGVLCGAAPVFRFATPHLLGSLRQGGRSMSQSRERHRARNLLVVVQVGLAVVLLVGAGLMIRTVSALTRVRPGFTEPERILTVRVSIPEAQVHEPERVLRMQNDMLDRLAALPGVEAVAFGNSITMDGRDSNDPIYAEDKTYSDSQIPPIRRFKFVSPGYFKAMGNPLVAGRDFAWNDLHGMHPVTIVSETLARELWGRPEAAIGKRIRESTKGVWREVIGVSGIEHDNGVDQSATAIVYWPALMRGVWGERVQIRRTVSFAIRGSRAGSPGFLREVEKAVWTVNAGVPLANIETVEAIYRGSMARTSFTLAIMLIAGAMALLLGIVGIYGVLSYSVSQRTREVGIRLALGAQQPQVRRMFLREGLVLAGVGIACGLAAAAAATRLMSALLYGVSAADPLTYAAVPACLLVAVLLACYLPARRASSIAPVEALRAAE